METVKVTIAININGEDKCMEVEINKDMFLEDPTGYMSIVGSQFKHELEVEESNV